MSRPEPDQLLTLAQAGDPAALDELLRLQRTTVFRYGLRVCRSTEDAEDAVQETLWAAARSIRSFRRAAAITTWLFTIVRNKCYRLLRHRHAEPDLADALPMPPPGAVEEELAVREISRILVAALSRLDPGHREVILLRDVEGLTAPEAAARLGLSVQALKSRLHRARQALREEASAVQPHRRGHAGGRAS